MTEELFKLPVLECLRCGHTWVPRYNRYPQNCPKCNSPYWDKPRQTKDTGKEKE